jgi:hypothetical protein
MNTLLAGASGSVVVGAAAPAVMALVMTAVMFGDQRADRTKR